MKAIKAVLMSGFAVALACAASFSSAADLLDDVRSSGVLKVAMEGTYPPFDYRNKSGELEGFDVDVAKALAERLKVKPQFITTEWAGILGGLQASKFDVIINQVTITPARQKALDFSQPYVYSSVQFLQRKNDDREFKSLSDLDGKKVGVTVGSVFVDFMKSVPGAQVRTYSGTPEALSDLASGRVDAVLNDRLMNPYLIKTSGLPLRVGASLPDGTQEIAIPFRKDNPKFAEAVNVALNEMRQDGTLQQIAIKWFGADTTTPVVN
jgi:L-cystine transport system substrate-binding protein